jgi:hypothetical protein
LSKNLLYFPFVNFLSSQSDLRSTNNLKSALSTIFSVAQARSLGTSVLVSRFSKGNKFNHPSKPKYDDIWDVNLLLNYIKTLGENRSLDLSTLRSKSIVLLRIERIARSSDVASIPFESIKKTRLGYSFRYFSTKESREGSWSTIQKISFSSPKSICAAYAIEEYLRRTEEFRDNVEGDNNLFLSLDGLHSLSSQSIAKLCKSMMDNARIPSRFTAGSIRHAAACAAIDAGVPVDEVLKIGRWRSREVFEKYYWIATRGSTNIIKAVNSNIQR